MFVKVIASALTTTLKVPPYEIEASSVAMFTSVQVLLAVTLERSSLNVPLNVPMPVPRISEFVLSVIRKSVDPVLASVSVPALIVVLPV